MSGTATAAEPARRSGLTLFRVAGIAVRLDFTWLFIFALILVSLAGGYLPRAHPDLPTASYWVAGLVATLLFFASIVVHELSHALMARASGIRVPAITLFLFGGVSEMAEEPSKPATELRVAAVGPVASFALAAVFFALHAALEPTASPLTAGVVQYLAWINTALGVFNLLPGLPLDGGRILRAAAWWRTGSLRRATRIAANAGRGIALGLMILGGVQIFAGALVGGFWLVLIGLFLRRTAEAGYQSLLIRQSLADVSVLDVAIRDPVTVSPATSLQTLAGDYFLRHGFRSYPVVEDGRVRGLISIEALGDLDEDARRDTTVGERMIPLSDAVSVAPDVPVAEALEQIAAAPGGRLLVLDDGQLVGLLTRSALARAIEIRGVLTGADSAAPDPSRERVGEPGRYTASTAPRISAASKK